MPAVDWTVPPDDRRAQTPTGTAESAERTGPGNRYIRWRVAASRSARRGMQVRERRTSEGETMTLAVLGTGIMGGAMARNWLKAGERVRVWNRTAAKAQPLAEAG